MKLGILTRNFAGYPETGRSSLACVDFAVEADRLGYDSVWVTDHIVLPKAREALYPHNDSGHFPHDWRDEIHDPMVLLGALAVATKRVEIGTAVLVIPYRHPLTTAKMLATADQLSQGRLILGAGVGWLKDEFDALGISQEIFDHRGGVTEDYLAVMRKAWEAPDAFAHDGPYVRFGEIGARPQPTAPGRPPVWIGGKGERALKRAVRIGDGYFAISSDVALLAEETRRLRELEAAAGRDRLTVALIEGFTVCAKPIDGERRMLSGSPAQIVDDLAALAKAGLDHMVAGIRLDRGWTYADSIEALEILAAEVLPHCAGLEGLA